MFLTTTATLLLLTLGPVLAALGVAVFCLEATHLTRDREALRAGRALATVGRWCAALGVAVRLLHGGQFGTPMVFVLLLATLAASATFITKANLTTRQPATYA